MPFNRLLSVLDHEGTADILTVIESNSDCDIGKMLILHKDGTIEGRFSENIIRKIQDMVQTTVWAKPITFTVEDQPGEKYRIFWDRIMNHFRAVVFGGGHISQPLVQILSLLDFDVTVIDDRPEFANQARFSGAKKVICESFQQAVQNIAIDSDTAVIIVTRGHRYDLDCLRATVHSNARYLGMIGSRRRVKELINIVLTEGAPADIERRLKAPIGLDIKAETPAEIAVSIAAELICVFHGGSGNPLSGRKEVL